MKTRVFSKLMFCCLILMLLCAGTAEDYSSLRLRELYSSQGAKVTWTSTSDLILYDEYLAQYDGIADYSSEPIEAEIYAVEGQDTSIRVTVSETAFYNVYYAYQCENSESNLFASFMLDGVVPYREASSIAFDWLWQEESQPIRNIIGDDVRPRQIRVSSQNEHLFFNSEGCVSGALKFYLESGTHDIQLHFSSEPVILRFFELRAPEQTENYETILKNAVDYGYKIIDKVITLEAEENVFSKNSASIQRVVSDDPLSTPYDKGYKRLNTIGGTTFQDGLQYISWSLDIPEDGLYTLTFRCNTPTNQLPVYRRVEIDSTLPFTEAASVEFPFMEDFQAYSLPYLFPLTAGKHILTLTVDVSPYADDIYELQQVNDELSDMVLNLTMLIGSNPDPNYDYNIEKSIPTIQDDLTGFSDRLLTICDSLHERSKGTSLVENSLRQNAELLLSVKRNIKRIQNNTTDIASIQSNLSLWEEGLAEAPLQIDRIFIGASSDDPMTSSVLQKVESVLYNFMLSFSKDYDQVGGRADGKEATVLDVWVSTSTEAADILKSLCDATFTEKTGIYVNLNILPAGQLNAGAVNVLLLSIVSGNEPDVALGVSNGSPVELAIRDAVVDLSKLPGYDDLISKVPVGAITVNSFNGGVYGIPERLGFSVMFYRKDILSALQLSLPDTWEDVYNDTLPILYQNNMQMLIPQNYSMFLYQNGGSYFDETGLKTTLDTPVAYQAFKSMVELYTKYAIPYTTNFYNRFRTGEVPIGVAGFGDYMSLTVGAKNLNGKWGVSVIPGTVREDGTISHATSGAVESSAVIMQASDKKEASWEFLKWWMSTETQYEYAREVEKRIGTGSRVNTANTEAFAMLDWPAEDLPILLATREQAVETPGVLGGYYVSRHINNAWNAVITSTDQTSVRSEFEYAIEMVQTEMDNKQAEYAHFVEP